MKRETKLWLKNQPWIWKGAGDEERAAKEATSDALDSDARLRAELRDYKKTTRYADVLVASLRAEMKRLNSGEKKRIRIASKLVPRVAVVRTTSGPVQTLHLQGIEVDELFEALKPVRKVKP